MLQPVLLNSDRSGAREGIPASPPAPFDDTTLAIPILVIEDESMIVWMLLSVLEEFGFQFIATVASGEEGLSRAAEMPPGLIISDINLGAGLDGVSAVAAIRANTQAPAIFISGYASSETLERIHHEMPDALFLRKPLQIDELRTALQRVLTPPTVQ